LKDLQAAPEGLELDALAPVEQITRQLSAPELLNGEPESQPTSSE
jgi:hypothetical protein